MLFVKIIGMILLCSLAATDIITFKPFVKSRYSLRGRMKSTTMTSLMKLDENVLNSSTEADIHLDSTQKLEVTQSTHSSPSLASQPQETSTTGSLFLTKKAELPETTINYITTTGSEVINAVNKGIAKEVTDKSSTIHSKIAKSPEATTQTEWVYDYYASDDENPRRN